jgi:hypothetical protein
MKNSYTSLKNLKKNIICYSKKMIPIGLVRTRITYLDSYSCVFVLSQGLEIETVFFMVGLAFHLLLMNRLLEVIRKPAVSVETWL